MGLTNMKGFVMSLQKKSKVHHAILVEQVRLIFWDVFFCFNLQSQLHFTF